MTADDDSLTVHEYANIRPLMVRLYCHEDSQYIIHFMTKTADAEFVKAAVGEKSA